MCISGMCVSARSRCQDELELLICGLPQLYVGVLEVRVWYTLY